MPSRFALPDGGVVPGNFGELAVFYSGDKMFPRAGYFRVNVRAAEDPSIVLLSGDTKAATGSSLSLGALLTPGKSYLIEASPICAHSAQNEPLPAAATTTLHVAAPSPPPTTLGPLKLVRSGSASVPIGEGASCWEDHAASVADVALNPEALPAAWRPLLTHYQLMVDGEPFNWSMTVGARGPTDSPAAFYLTEPREFRAWTLCEDPNPPGAVAARAPLPTGVSPGKHTLWVRARVPSHPASVIESDKIEVHVRCPFCVDYCGPTPQAVATPTTATVAQGDSDVATPAQEPQPEADGVGPEDEADESTEEDAAGRPQKSSAGCSAARGTSRSNDVGLLLSVLSALFVTSRWTRVSRRR